MMVESSTLAPVSAMRLTWRPTSAPAASTLAISWASLTAGYFVYSATDVVHADQHRGQVAGADRAVRLLGVDLRRRGRRRARRTRRGCGWPARRPRGGRVASGKTGRKDARDALDQIALTPQTSVGSVADTVALTLYLLPLASCRVDDAGSISSPKAMTRVAWKCVVVLAAAAAGRHQQRGGQAPQPSGAGALARIHCHSKRLQEESGSGRRRAAEPIANPVPLGTGRRLFDPDQMHALAVEFAQDRKQFVRRLLGPRRHAPVHDAGGDARRDRPGIYRQLQRLRAEHLRARSAASRWP